MALPAFLRIPEIKGSSQQKGREGLIEVQGFNFDVVSDLEYGVRGTILAAIEDKHKAGAIVAGPPYYGEVKLGVALNKPAVITKPLDVSTPYLRQAMGTREKKADVFKIAELLFFKQGAGQEENYFTLTMHNARIIGIKLIMQNVKEADKVNYPEQEEVSFVFSHVEYKFETKAGGGLQAQKSSSIKIPVKFAVPTQAAFTAVLQDFAKDLVKNVAGVAYEAMGKKPPADPPPAVTPEEPQ